MPAFLEAKLKDEYGENSDIPYKVMNSIGAMHGNKVTQKGLAMEAKHKADSMKKHKKAMAQMKGAGLLKSEGNGTAY